MARRQKKFKAVIKNYGIMWRRDYIFWGRGGQRGSLEGRRSGRKIEFREQIGVYVLYDESRRPIYVGQAGQGNARLFNRLRGHTRDHLALRWHYVTWFGLLSVNQVGGRLSGHDKPTKRVFGTLRSTLNEIEGVLIAATEPMFNRQGARFRGIDRYAQVPHEEAEATSMGEIYDLVEKTRAELVGRINKLSRARRRK